MKLVGLVENRRVETLTLLGDDVHDNRVGILFCLFERLLNRSKIVPIDWADVLKVEVWKHALRRNRTEQTLARSPDH